MADIALAFLWHQHLDIDSEEERDMEKQLTTLANFTMTGTTTGNVTSKTAGATLNPELQACRARSRRGHRGMRGLHPMAAMETGLTVMQNKRRKREKTAKNGPFSPFCSHRPTITASSTVREPACREQSR